MNKVLVTIYVVKLDQEFEVFLPPNKRICDLTIMLSNSLYEITNGVFQITNQNLFFDLENNCFCDPNTSLKDAHINNGKKLLFL